ncbi:hypothetical protein HN011_007570 [Eciton burchellii]|nr:hypothetical protein HN011_007570 [Eciton burchellii]
MAALAQKSQVKNAICGKMAAPCPFCQLTEEARHCEQRASNRGTVFLRYICASSNSCGEICATAFRHQRRRLTRFSQNESRNMLILKATVVNCSCRHIRVARNFFSKYNKSSVNSTRKMSFEDEKQKFLNMPLEEKRSFYKGNVTTMDQIPTWSEYWGKNKLNITKTIEKTDKVDEKFAGKVSIWQGDITSLQIDAIVNAANSSLLGGGGVDGAIHRAAGPNLKMECITLGGCRVGEAKITGGYMIPAKYVIHTVGPQGEKPEKLRECYENSLALAKKNQLRTIAFPCISTGIYGYPQRPAAKVALSAVKKFLVENKDVMDRVIFCLFLKTDKEIYEDLLQKYFGLD